MYVYLKVRNGVDVLNQQTEALCELLWNDMSHIEETKAILAQLLKQSQATSRLKNLAKPPKTIAQQQKSYHKQQNP